MILLMTKYCQQRCIFGTKLGSFFIAICATYTQQDFRATNLPGPL
jgi:hypothetical protein